MTKTLLTKTHRMPAALATAALSASLLAVPAVAFAPAAGAAETCTYSGTADWAIKQSTMRYVVGPIAHGKVETSGATTFDAGAKTLHWTVDAAKSTGTAGSATVDLGGGVHLFGHDYGNGYLLDSNYSNVVLKIEGDTGKVLADATVSEFTPEMMATREPGQRLEKAGLELATIKFDSAPDLTAGDITATGHTFLTADGAKYWGVYSEGEQFDDLNLHLAAKCESPAPAPAPQGGEGGSSAGVIGIVAVIGGLAAAAFAFLQQHGLLPR